MAKWAKIDDSQAAKAEADPGRFIHPLAGVVRAPVLDLARHRLRATLQHIVRRIRHLPESADAAHGLPRCPRTARKDVRQHER